MDYKITEHAKQRYAERIMDRDNKTDIAVYINQNEEKIRQDILKMITFGTVIYTGKPVNNTNNNNTVDVILKDHWIVLVDKSQGKVVTLFVFFLGVGKEFNDEYIGKLLERLNAAKEKYAEEVKVIDQGTADFNEIIDENEGKIREYKAYIKSLEQQNTNMVGLIAESKNNKAMAEQEVRDIVSVFCGKKVF